MQNKNKNYIAIICIVTGLEPFHEQQTLTDYWQTAAIRSVKELHDSKGILIHFMEYMATSQSCEIACTIIVIYCMHFTIIFQFVKANNFHTIFKKNHVIILKKLCDHALV